MLSQDYAHSLMKMTERGDFATIDRGCAVPRAIPPIFNVDALVKRLVPVIPYLIRDPEVLDLLDERYG